MTAAYCKRFEVASQSGVVNVHQRSYQMAVCRHMQGVASVSCHNVELLGGVFTQQGVHLPAGVTCGETYVHGSRQYSFGRGAQHSQIACKFAAVGVFKGNSPLFYPWCRTSFPSKTSNLRFRGKFLQAVQLRDRLRLFPRRACFREQIFQRR